MHVTLQNCPVCSFANRDDASFCGMCGTRLTELCVACHFPNPSTYRFCIRCGQPLQKDAAEQVYTQESPAQNQVATANNIPLEPTPDELVLKGERRVATIILADVQGSTNLLEKLGSETWVQVMNRVFRILEGEIYRFGGKVDQFRGDGLVAFFGTTVAHEDDPERAILAAMAMQRALGAYAAEFAAQEQAELWLRVGVNTGEVIVASIGDDNRYSEQTAMGEAVALAARMETAAEPGTVLVSENTYRLTEDRFEWLALGSVQVKGISQPVNVYRPLTQRVGAERLAEFGLSGALIGRQEQLAQLKTCIEELNDGIGGIAMLVAERGMGKSLLLAELRRHYARQRALLAEANASEPAPTDERNPDLGNRPTFSHFAKPVPVFHEVQGRARSYDQAQPYTMWQDLLRNWLGHVTDEPSEQTASRLRNRLEALNDDRAYEIYPDLARLLSLPTVVPSDQKGGRFDSDTSRQRTFVAVRSWVEVLAQRSGPLVVTFSDMHWADPISLELLRYCLPVCDYEDILWLLVFRPDRATPAWELRYHIETEYPHRLTTITLPPLDASQSEELVDQLIGVGSLPAETRALIVEKAEGNPYYIQEYIRALIADGMLEPMVDSNECIIGWEAKQVATKIAVPDSLQSLLLARIDRLPAEEQRVLQLAAVVGTVFWSDTLRAMAPELRNLGTHITNLQRAQLIAERGRLPVLGIEYVFRSSLVRDAAYESLLTSQRALYHSQVAEYLESLADSVVSMQPARYYSSLAYHFHHAQQPEKELHYTLLSAREAEGLHAHAEAKTYYSRALEILDSLVSDSMPFEIRCRMERQRFEVLMGRHRVLYLRGEYSAMQEDVRRLLPLARSLPQDETLLIDALLHQPGIGDFQQREEIVQAIPLAEEALVLSRKLGDKRRELESLIAITNQKLALNDPAWHLHAEEALSLARELGDANYEARILVGMGSIYAFSDYPERSQQYLEAAAALAMTRGVDDRVVQLSLLNLLGLEFERSGDYYRLLTDYQEERLRASREIGHRPIESRALQACGRIQGIYLGDYPSALNTLEECRRIDKDTPDEVYPLFHIAHIMIEQGNLDPAYELLSAVRDIGDPVQDRARASYFLTQAMLQSSYGSRAADEGHHDQASSRYRVALEITEKAILLARANPLVSRQYEMAAQCKASLVHLSRAQIAEDDSEYQISVARALEASSQAHELYQTFGFAQIVECVSEEVLYCHSLALSASGQEDQAARFLRRAYDEMMRKYALIPQESPYRRTYLEQIPLHLAIRQAYTIRVGSLLVESVPHQA